MGGAIFGALGGAIPGALGGAMAPVMALWAASLNGGNPEGHPRSAYLREDKAREKVIEFPATHLFGPEVNNAYA